MPIVKLLPGTYGAAGPTHLMSQGLFSTDLNSGTKSASFELGSSLAPLKRSRALLR
jgi:hypothetical protein